MKVRLSTPIEAHGKEVAELEFRELVAGDLRGVDIVIGEGGMRIGMGDILNVAARLANVPPSSLDKLTFKDAMAVVGEVAPLFDELPMGGKGS